MTLRRDRNVHISIIIIVIIIIETCWLRCLLPATFRHCLNLCFLIVDNSSDDWHPQKIVNFCHNDKPVTKFQVFSVICYRTISVCYFSIHEMTIVFVLYCIYQ